MKMLFLCVTNSAQSQMAEGVAKNVLPSYFQVRSAGSEPSGVLQLFAIHSMLEVGIDISKQQSKSIEALESNFLEDLDLVITLCEEKVFPSIRSKIKIQWQIQDPSTAQGPEAARIAAYRIVREQIVKHVRDLAIELKVSMGIVIPGVLPAPETYFFLVQATP